MRSFWTAKIFLKGVSSKRIWISPKFYPIISLDSHNDMYFTKQKNFTRLKIRSERNVFLPPSFRGSITIETSLVLPLFLFFCIQIISLISLIQLHSALEAALHQEVAQAAVQTYAADKLGIDLRVAGGLLENGHVRTRVIERAGREYLDRSMIDGGSNGIHILLTGEEDEQDTVDVILFYRVKPSWNLLGFQGFTMANRCRMKAWTGYRIEEDSLAGEGTEELVYITETGSVYHKSRNCSHLALSTRAVATDSLSVLRNEDGGKYYPCEHCGEGNGSVVFLTDQGNRYHRSLGCSGLKRTIYTVSISETGGRGACSRCSGTG